MSTLQPRTMFSQLPGRGLCFSEVIRPWRCKRVFVCFSLIIQDLGGLSMDLEAWSTAPACRGLQPPAGACRRLRRPAPACSRLKGFSGAPIRLLCSKLRCSKGWETRCQDACRLQRLRLVGLLGLLGLQVMDRGL